MDVLLLYGMHMKRRTRRKLSFPTSRFLFDVAMIFPTKKEMMGKCQQVPTCPVSQRAQSAFFPFPFSYFHSVCIKLCVLLSSPDCHDDGRQAGATGCKEYTRRIKSRYNAINGECTLIFSLVSLLSGPQNVFSASKTLRHSLELHVYNIS